MFVHANQVGEIGKRHPELGKLRLIAARHDDKDVMILRAESSVCSDEFVAAVGQSLKEITKITGSVELVAAGELPNDGLVIADERDYDS